MRSPTALTSFTLIVPTHPFQRSRVGFYWSPSGFGLYISASVCKEPKFPTWFLIWAWKEDAIPSYGTGTQGPSGMTNGDVSVTPGSRVICNAHVRVYVQPTPVPVLWSSGTSNQMSLQSVVPPWILGHPLLSGFCLIFITPSFPSVSV